MAFYLVSVQHKAIVGSFVQAGGGWKFISWTQNGTSRKRWASAAEATPRNLRKHTQLVEAATPQDALAKV